MALKNHIEWLSLPSAPQPEIYHRQLLLLATDYPDEKINELIGVLPETLKLAVMENAPASGNHKKNTWHFTLSHFKKVLGQEFDIGIYNAYSGFRPSALLALSGTLRHAGRLVIVCPPLSDWEHHSSVTQPHYLSYGFKISQSLFIRHFITKLSNDDAVAVCEENSGVKRLPVKKTNYRRCKIPSQGGFLNSGQQCVFNDVMKEVEAGTSLCTFTAPRGRGKSALLGLIAAALLKKNIKLYLASAQYHSQSVFYNHLAQQLDCSISNAMQQVKWLAPDNPDAADNDADLLLIDEAASLPLPVLHKLTTNNKQCLITTTTLGFEGSGLGFVHKFLKPLQARKQLCHFTLNEPVRWAVGDPLERILDNSLLFNNVFGQFGIQKQVLTCKHVMACTLDSDQLAQLFHLLSDAHYQTSPDDLMRLTDAPDVSIVLGFYDKTLVAAAVINHEGGAQLGALSEHIAQGNRRVKGHLSAQSLGLIAVDKSLVQHSYWRINRIAVDSHYRRNGVGSALISYIFNNAQKQQVDWITSSYASSPEVDAFWFLSGFIVLRRGKKPDKSSGQVSNLVATAISCRAKSKFDILKIIHSFDSANEKDTTLYLENPIVNKIVNARMLAYFDKNRSRELTGNAFFAWVAKRKASILPHSVLFDYVMQQHHQDKIIQSQKLKGRKEFEEKLLIEAKQLNKGQLSSNQP